MSISKFFTYECGRCGSVYSISQDDLGQSGAKITCPKCYSFFYLKPPREDIKPPIIEKIATRDGEYQDNGTPPIPGEKTTEKILSEAIEALSYPAIKDNQPVYPTSNSDNLAQNKVDLSPEKPSSDEQTNSLIQHHVPSSVETDLDAISIPNIEKSNLVEELWHKDSDIEQEIHKLPDSPNTPEQSAINLGLEEVTGNFYDPETVITQDSLSDYPEEPPETSMEKSIVWLASIFLALCLVLFAHYNRNLTLPFLNGFQKALPTATPQAIDQNSEIPSSGQSSKYGFPEVEQLDEDEIIDDEDVDVYNESLDNTQQRPAGEQTDTPQNK
ncbi:MAG TPA: hypothetical protein PKC21_00340 [Oligoflexia bacterium]|nr:hypothetical protein [Oligoflexia bacterium]HMR23775.1 hypothetical protein [Oligoflexia bacterium]